MCSLFSFPLLLIFSIFFYPNPLFTFEMEILTSQKGKPQVALDGFLYVIGKNDKKIYWKCLALASVQTIHVASLSVRRRTQFTNIHIF